MKMWARMGIGVAAIALAVAAGTGAYAMRGRDGSPKDATRDADTQQKRAADDASGSSLAMCAVEVPECNDLIVLPEGEQARCAEAVESCVDTPCVGGPAVDCMAPQPSGVCYTLDTDPITTRCAEEGCAPSEPVGAPVDEPMPTDLETGAAPPPAVEPGAIGTGCLGEDPCAISSEMKCLPPDCAISSDGTIACPEPVPCEIPPVGATPFTVEPDATAIAEGASSDSDELPPPTEPCVIDPCYGNDPYAGIPADCPPVCEPPVAPDGSTETAAPCSAPCDQPDPESLVHPCTPPEPCTPADEPAAEPEVDTRPCPSTGGGGSSGSSGSAPSDPGVVEPVPDQ